MSSYWDWGGAAPYSDEVSRQSPVQDQPMGTRVPLTIEDPLVVASVVGAAFFVTQVLQSFGPLLQGPGEHGLLEDDVNCGLTTGGKEECHFDCKVRRDLPAAVGLIVEDLDCILDCFPAENCFSSLLQDVKNSKTCKSEGIPLNFWPTTDTCDVVHTATDYTINTGTCSPMTETLMKTPECLKIRRQLPYKLELIVLDLVTKSCKGTYKKIQSSKQRQTNGNQQTRLPPIDYVNLGRDFKTDVQFPNTRHRYPWICSLKTRGVNPEHLCTVTLLAVPPRPTVVVGAAHCTYICRERDGQGVALPSCCCVSQDEAQFHSCTGEDQCGTQPRAVEIDGEYAEILCGEWETGPATRESSEEEYNVVLPINKIVRHENFDAADEGPGAGSDIAVFVVDDSKLASSQHAIHPACLPPKGRAKPKVALHAGWSRPPPYNLLYRFARGFTWYYKDFFKLWHYRMDVLPCQDPKTFWVSNTPLKYSTNTYYPPGTICAGEMAKESCFSAGESGSPLMVNETRTQKLFVEGILSYTKGCTRLQLVNYKEPEPELVEDKLVDRGNQLRTFTINPAVYTKLSCFLPWVARQYGMKHEGDPEDEDCRVGRGEKESTQECREVQQTLHQERQEKCLFPFYYRDKLYNECFLFVEEEFVFPSYLCPVRNIVTKRNGINDFGDLDITKHVPVNSDGELDPSLNALSASKYLFPFRTCMNDCPGVKSYGIIGGGALLLTGTALGSLGALGGPALLPIAGLGGAAMLGMTSMMMCTTPFCRAPSGQCCMLIGSARGPRCPRSC